MQEEVVISLHCDLLGMVVAKLELSAFCQHFMYNSSIERKRVMQ